jgi:serine/threonine protein kinase
MQLRQATPTHTGRLPGALVEVEDPDVMAIIRACINHDPTQRPSAAELLSLPFYAEADSNTDEQKTEIRVLGSLRDTAPGDPKVVHLQLQLPREGQKREMVPEPHPNLWALNEG